MHRSPHRQAFSLIELMIVIGVLMALAAVGFPLMEASREAGRRDAARAQIAAVAAAIADRGTHHLVTAHGHSYRLPLWDLDLDGYLDGNLDGGEDAIDPGRIALLIGTSLGETEIRHMLTQADYGGFVATTGFALGDHALSPGGRPLDPWGRPLRYACAPLRRGGAAPTVDLTLVRAIAEAEIRTAAVAAAPRFGPRGFAVWSAGADGRDGTADDLASFPPEHVP